MANIRAGTTWYVDTTGTLTGSDQMFVSYIIVGASGGAGTVTLQDNAPSPSDKIYIAVPSGDTKILDFSSQPIPFFGGVKVSAISNARATIVIKG